MSTIQSYSDKELVSLISRDNEHAFSIFFSRYYNRIYGKSLQIVKVSAIAQDIAQQVFLAVWERRAELPKVKEPSAWLFGIARNLVADLFRSKLVEEKYLRFAIEFLETAGQSPEDLILNQQRSEILSRSLQELSPKQKEIYKLSREEGKTYQEIADLLGVSKETVKEYMQIALAKIRKYLLIHREELIQLILMAIFIK
ncbi:RNA polymerase sigma factor [Chitinophaga sp. RCC_12]|uniref:RNA polymerase sigma factor n=1 Tax=Chitinophaga sp. RCC_12 TaxID=3239226 RepID=UPI003526557B